MHSPIHNTQRTKGPAFRFISSSIWQLCLLTITFCLSGCGDFFAEKPTELESMNILRELSQITPVPEAAFPLPEFYTQPPKIVEGIIGDKTDAKLFYFTRYHTVEKLAKILDEQFRKRFKDAKGKEYPVADYTISQNRPTNQLIVRCPTVADAEQVIEFLEHVDVPPVQIKIDCLISEVYADHTMDWETTIEIDNLLGEGVSLGGDGQPAFPGAALRDVARSTFGLKTGYVRNPGVAGHEFKALVDLLASRGYLKILMNPQLEVVNGETATIRAEERVPIDQISYVNPSSDIITKSTQYVDVVDSLEVTPYVFGDGSIGLKTRALIGSKSTPEGVKQLPIVTKREVQIEENRIRQGESLIIGGIRKVEKRSVVRGVPFLKDIPFIGILFSSKDFEERGKEILFILTPTISSGGVPNDEMVDFLRGKHDMVVSDPSLADSIMDPFGTGKYTDMIEEEATAAEVGRVKAEIAKTHVERKAQWLADELRKAKEQVIAQQEMADKTQNKLANLRDEVDKTKVEAQAQFEAEKKKALKAQSELEKIKAEAKAAKDAAVKAQQEAEKASKEAQRANQPKPDKVEAPKPKPETSGKTDTDKKGQVPPPAVKESPPAQQPPKTPDTKERTSEESFPEVSFRPLKQQSDSRLADQ